MHFPGENPMGHPSYLCSNRLSAMDYKSSSVAQLQITQWLHAIQNYEEGEV